MKSLHALAIASVAAITFLPQSKNHGVAFGFRPMRQNNRHLSPQRGLSWQSKLGNNPRGLDSNADDERIGNRRRTSQVLMVRNVDLPEALVFYGWESVLQPPELVTAEPDDKKGLNRGDSGDEALLWKLRPGIARLLHECQELGTAALVLSESAIPAALPEESTSGSSLAKGGYEDEEALRRVFETAWNNYFQESSSNEGGGARGGRKSQPPLVDGSMKILNSFTEGENPTLSFRSIYTDFDQLSISPDAPSTTDNIDSIIDDSEDEFLPSFYNLQTLGRSPSPSYLVDSLNSILISPRGFGGSSGFGRGQWVEPSRSPLMARTVVFVSGDFSYQGVNLGIENAIISERNAGPSTVKDRCAAARAAGCRLIYMEHPPLDQPDSSQSTTNAFAVNIQEDTEAMNLCDAVLSTYGTDHPNNNYQTDPSGIPHPITLDTVSTPGEYWLNPPMSRDDGGNVVNVEEVVEWFRLSRSATIEMDDRECIIINDGDRAEEEQGDLAVKKEEEIEDMSEEELKKILADLDGI